MGFFDEIDRSDNLWNGRLNLVNNLFNCSIPLVEKAVNL